MISDLTRLSLIHLAQESNLKHHKPEIFALKAAIYVAREEAARLNLECADVAVFVAAHGLIHITSIASSLILTSMQNNHILSANYHNNQHTKTIESEDFLKLFEKIKEEDFVSRANTMYSKHTKGLDNASLSLQKAQQMFMYTYTHAYAAFIQSACFGAHHKNKEKAFNNYFTAFMDAAFFGKKIESNCMVRALSADVLKSVAHICMSACVLMLALGLCAAFIPSVSLVLTGTLSTSTKAVLSASAITGTLSASLYTARFFANNHIQKNETIHNNALNDLIQT